MKGFVSGKVWNGHHMQDQMRGDGRTVYFEEAEGSVLQRATRICQGKCRSMSADNLHNRFLSTNLTKDYANRRGKQSKSDVSSVRHSSEQERDATE